MQSRKDRNDKEEIQMNTFLSNWNIEGLKSQVRSNVQTDEADIRI